jgi:hypothetical protein
MSNYFVKKSYNLGRVKVGSSHKISYTYNEGVTIKRLELSCGCSEADVQTATRSIIVTYKVKAIPAHLKMEGVTEAQTTKKVTVFFEVTDAPGVTLEETLTFNATVVE